MDATFRVGTSKVLICNGVAATIGVSELFHI